jgi:thiol-disulfide isomerase/thioredoxin
MNRRDFMKITATISLATPLLSGTARAGSGPYSAEAVAADLAAGKFVVLDFTASWCPSCQAQGRRIKELRAENPGYDAIISFVDVDWDIYKKSDLAKKYGIVNRGSLVILKGDKVLAQTSTHSSKDALKAMFDQAVASA